MRVVFDESAHNLEGETSIMPNAHWGALNTAEESKLVENFRLYNLVPFTDALIIDSVDNQPDPRALGVAQLIQNEFSLDESRNLAQAGAVLVSARENNQVAICISLSKLDEEAGKRGHIGRVISRVNEQILAPLGQPLIPNIHQR